MEDLLSSALPAVCGLVSFWLAWLLHARRIAAKRSATVRGPQVAVLDDALVAQATLAVATKARTRRRPVERWLARVQRRAPAPSDAAANTLLFHNDHHFARLGLAA